MLHDDERKICMETVTFTAAMLALQRRYRQVIYVLSTVHKQLRLHESNRFIYLRQ